MVCRFLILLLLVTACKKKEEPEPEPVLTGSDAPRGMSVTKLPGGSNDEGSGEGSESGGGGRLSTAGAGGTNVPGEGSSVAVSAKPVDGGVPADAQLFGGNGAAAYMDDEGHMHGPGGPVFMGRGAECNAERDHCMREGVWFSVGNLVAGKLYRAVPIYEFEGKWFNWRGKEESFAMRFKTKVGTRDTLRAGDPVIWFIDENASKKFVDNEYDALTSSRWEAGVVESISGDKIRVKGWTYGTVPIDTTRVIVERR